MTFAGGGKIDTVYYVHVHNWLVFINWLIMKRFDCFIQLLPSKLRAKEMKLGTLLVLIALTCGVSYYCSNATISNGEIVVVQSKEAIPRSRTSCSTSKDGSTSCSTSNWTEYRIDTRHQDGSFETFFMQEDWFQRKFGDRRDEYNAIQVEKNYSLKVNGFRTENGYTTRNILEFQEVAR